MRGPLTTRTVAAMLGATMLVPLTFGDTGGGPKPRPAIKVKAGWVHSLAFSPDGKQLAAGSPYRATVWDVPSAKLVHTLGKHASTVYAVAWRRDGKVLATSDGEYLQAPGNRDRPGEIKLWNVATGKQAASLKGHTCAVYSLTFLSDGKTLFSAGGQNRGQLMEAGEVKWWNLATGRPQRAATYPLKMYYPKITTTLDGKTLAVDSPRLDRTGVGHNDVKLRSAATGRDLHTFLGMRFGVTQSLAFSADGKYLAAGWKHGQVLVYDVAKRRELHRLKGHTDKVLSVAFSPDGATLASGSQDTTVRLWDVKSGKELHELKGRTRMVLSVAFRPNGGLLAAGSYDDNSPPGEDWGLIQVWQLKKGGGKGK